MLLAGNNNKPYEIVSPFAIKVNKCLTITAYLVKYDYYQTLIDTIRESLVNLIQYREYYYMYTIDSQYTQLQEKDKWYLLYPETVIQMDGYSDVVGSNIDYKKKCQIILDKVESQK